MKELGIENEDRFPEVILPNIREAFPVLETSRLILDKITAEHASSIFEYASEPRVSLYEIWECHESLDDTIDFIEGWLAEAYAKDIPSWALIRKEDYKMIGTVGFAAVDCQHRNADIGWVVSDKYWNQGYATEAARRIIEYGFEVMKLHRIQARCYTENMASLRVMEKVFLKQEGVCKEKLFRNGCFHDEVCSGLVMDEWRRRKS